MHHHHHHHHPQMDGWMDGCALLRKALGGVEERAVACEKTVC
jgi:hypothetical protein